ncbi:uncharacterized protein LOC136029502 [Artemia franciscana]|uniref:uncharacterized protein LOC136029502 n=1 Tax=Artemia franciscana TaxID=6661 RepID=UPI0032DB7E4D
MSGKLSRKRAQIPATPPQKTSDDESKKRSSKINRPSQENKEDLEKYPCHSTPMSSQQMQGYMDTEIIWGESVSPLVNRIHSGARRIPSCSSPGDNSPPVARRPRNLELLTSPVIQFKEKEKKAKSYKSSSPNPLEILEELVATLKKGSEKIEDNEGNVNVVVQECDKTAIYNDDALSTSEDLLLTQALDEVENGLFRPISPVLSQVSETPKSSRRMTRLRKVSPGLQKSSLVIGLRNDSNLTQKFYNAENQSSKTTIEANPTVLPCNSKCEVVPPSMDSVKKVVQCYSFKTKSLVCPQSETAKRMLNPMADREGNLNAERDKISIQGPRTSESKAVAATLSTARKVVQSFSFKMKAATSSQEDATKKETKQLESKKTESRTSFPSNNLSINKESLRLSGFSKAESGQVRKSEPHKLNDSKSNCNWKRWSSMPNTSRVEVFEDDEEFEFLISEIKSDEELLRASASQPPAQRPKSWNATFEEDFDAELLEAVEKVEADIFKSKR